ncbi:MAG: hypothetical protein AAFO59_04830, partial [Cyanobacteria bacterium J06607_17]
MKSVDDMQSNNDDLNPIKEQRSNLELSAQLEEIAAISRQSSADPSPANGASNLTAPTAPADSSDTQSEQPMAYRGVRYATGKERYSPEKLTVSQGSSLLQWFYDLPVSSKQLIGLISSEVISVIGLVGAGSLLIINGARQQLLDQSAAELAVTGIQYEIKVNQMGFGFRGQSENTAIVALAEGVAKNSDQV